MSGHDEASRRAGAAPQTVGRGAEPGPGRAPIRRVLPVAVTLAAIVLDAATKVWARHQAQGAPVWPGDWARVWHVTNAGASFGLGAGQPGVVLALSVAATAVVGWWWRGATCALERVALSVVMGGALGNLADRLVHGAVTDWLHVTWYPAAFNLADVAVRGGVVVAVVVRVAHQRGRAGRTHAPRRRVGRVRPRTPRHGPRH
jgi:signal peptidase II